MAPLARRRLKQAEHFLGLAVQHSGDREAFTTYFEALVVFGRSTLHVLKNEVDAAHVLSCFQSEWDALGKESLPTFFRDNRNIVLKTGAEGTGRRAEFTVSLPDPLLISDRVTVEVHRADGTVERSEGAGDSLSETLTTQPAKIAEVSALYFFTDGPFKDQDVFRVCRQYLDRLMQAIDAAEVCGA